MIIYKKHVQEFTLGLGYVWQTPIIMTEKEVKAEIENQGGQIYQNVRYEEIDIDEQAATIARLTAANESMQEDATQNTYAFNLMLTANKAQAEEIRALKNALTRITHTGVTLGNNQSAWDAWRLCATIANEAIK